MMGYDAGFKDGAILGYELAEKDIRPVLDVIRKYLSLCKDCILIDELKMAMNQLPHKLKKDTKR